MPPFLKVFILKLNIPYTIPILIKIIITDSWVMGSFFINLAPSDQAKLRSQNVKNNNIKQGTKKLLRQYGSNSKVIITYLFLNSFFTFLLSKQPTTVQTIGHCNTVDDFFCFPPLNFPLRRGVAFACFLQSVTVLLHNQCLI